MGYTLTINTKVKCAERFDEIAQYAQNAWTELNKANPDWWELTINAEECKLKWYSLSYKAFDVLKPVLDEMFQHFIDVVFIDELIAGSEHWGTYRIEAGKETRIRYNVLCLGLKTDEDKARIEEYLKKNDNDAFCNENDIEHRLDHSGSGLVWIYPITNEDIVKEYAERITAECPETQCYFYICDYEDRYWTPTYVYRKNGSDYTWEPIPEKIGECWETLLCEPEYDGGQFSVFDLFEPSEGFLKKLNSL